MRQRLEGMWVPLAVVFAIGCANERSGEAIGSLGARLTLSVDNRRVLGFEHAGDWSNFTQTSDQRTEGSSSAAVNVNGWTELTSIPLSTLGVAADRAVGPTATLDLMLPAAVGWGDLRVILRAPSLSEYYRELGVKPLAGLAPGAFHTIELAVPADLAAKLATAYSDLRISVIINAPGGTYLLDRLSFGSSGPPANTELELAIEIPVGAGLHRVALGATEALVVADGVVVDGPEGDEPPDVSSTGAEETNLGSTARLAGTVWSVGPVMLRDRGEVAGDVVTEAAFSHQSTWTVGGSVRVGQTLTPARTYSWTVEAPPASSSIDLQPTQRGDPAPGAFTTVSVKPGATLGLVPGTYFFQSLTAESGSTIEVAAGGPVFVYVRDGLTFRGQLVGPAASELLIGYVGGGVADIDAPFQGTVVAPNATVRLSPVDGSGQDGSFFGRRIEAGARNPIRFRAFAHWADVFPPVVNVECVSRTIGSFASALFGYENILDIPVDLPAGSRNLLAGTGLKQGPLEVFQPGLHPRSYWAAFQGTELTWSLGGQDAVVDATTRGCTLSDYTLRGVEVLEAPGDCSASTLEGHFGTNRMGFADDVPVLDPPAQGQAAPFAVTLYGLEVGSEGPLETFDLDAVVTVNGRSITRNLWHGKWSLLAQGIPIINEQFSFPEVTNEATFDLRVQLMERDWVTTDDPVVDFTFAVDNRTGVMTWRGRSGGSPVHLDGDRDWGISFAIAPTAPPRLCAQWWAQYSDAARGEDFEADPSMHAAPASFASVRLGITGGAAPFAPWTAWYPLDQDGCIPVAFTPGRMQLTRPAGAVSGPEITMEVAGSLVGGRDGSPSTFRIVNDRNQLFQLTETVSPGSGLPEWNPDGSPPADLVVTFHALNEFTKAAVVAGQMLRHEATGTDLGLVGQWIPLNVLSSDAVSSETPYWNESAVLLRPMDAVAGVPCGDTSLKTVTAHEIGHGIEAQGVGKISFFGYQIAYWDPRGNVDWKPNPDSAPPWCRCDHVQAGFSPLHCMQSLELPNAAQTEGFANFISARTWNNKEEGDCRYAYAKNVLAPECPPGLPPGQCQPPDPTTVAELAAEYGVDVASRWTVIQAPVAIDCADATRWRNTWCVDPAIATDDISSFATELDWTQFFWALTRGEPEARWEVLDIFSLYRGVCVARGLASASGHCWMPDISNSVISPAEVARRTLDWDALAAEAELMGGEKSDRFTQLGDVFGVSRALE